MQKEGDCITVGISDRVQPTVYKRISVVRGMSCSVDKNYGNVAVFIT